MCKALNKRPPADNGRVYGVGARRLDYASEHHVNKKQIQRYFKRMQQRRNEINRQIRLSVVLVVLLKNTKKIKRNLMIIAVLYVVAVVSGIVINAVMQVI